MGMDKRLCCRNVRGEKSKAVRVRKGTEMIRIQQLKMPLSHKREDIIKKAAKRCKIKPEQILNLEIVRRSVDARKKSEVCYVYTIDLTVENEIGILKKVNDKNIMLTNRKKYQFPKAEVSQKETKYRPVIIGAGPAGLFCAYELTKAGYAPILLERGKRVEERTEDVKRFWESGVLDTGSNVQFGEGGAGTFSDGKLNTLVKDRFGRSRHVLETFVEFGADAAILYDAKPHIGTDVLSQVIANMRAYLLEHGAEIRFSTQVTDFLVEDQRLQAVQLNHDEWMNTDAVVLAIGHSARDTFETLQKRQIPMEAKAFAVGFRVEHPQDMIDHIQYKGADMRYLSPASYKLTANFENHRGVYSFCMCPGGYVVDASSEKGYLAVNGMSYHDRAGKNANTAMIVSVTPEDFPGKDALAGVAFQRELEKKAFAMGNGKIPQQLYGDFVKKRISSEYGGFASCTRGKTAFAPLHELLPQELTETFIRGMEQFPRYIEDYNRYDAILSGIESRTSSPVRIWRNEEFESEIKGLYPCGEGAGYAGGIMSAAMDGIKIAEMIAKQYAPVK